MKLYVLNKIYFLGTQENLALYAPTERLLIENLYQYLLFVTHLESLIKYNNSKINKNFKDQTSYM